ncbi:MAG: hypothetical protein HY875_01875 [Chloroflexi bacterium]|nr:hypothetical protein [Chloroflexota bacterium]
MVLALFGAMFAVSVVSAEDGDSATVSRPQARIGEQLRLVVEVVTPAGATVEVDPGSPAWAGVEVARIERLETLALGDRSLHRIELVVAGFVPGERSFRPAVSVVNGSEVTPWLLPAVKLTVIDTLPAGAPLELSPLPPPSGIGGAESPFLRPGIVAGVAAGALFAALVIFLAGRAVVTLLRRSPPAQPQATPAPVDIDGAASLIDSDPVRAYRALGTVVRNLLARRYGFPAFALTTAELQRRMEAEGVDRWQSRLVGGLLQECDAVVYAGYRPAAERRQADINMAREIVEGVG